MRISILITAIALSSIQMNAQTLNYPKAHKDNTIDEYFGVKVADPYRWLEDDNSKQTAEWVEAENQVTSAYLQKIPFREKLLKRLRQVADYEKVGTPFEKNGRWYYYRNDGLQNQSVLYVMDQLGGIPPRLPRPQHTQHRRHRSPQGGLLLQQRPLRRLYHLKKRLRLGGDLKAFYIDSFMFRELRKIMDDDYQWPVNCHLSFVKM